MKQIDTLEGFPIFFCEEQGEIARSTGFFWGKRVVLGPLWSRLPEPERRAVVLHEIAHCLGFHRELRVVLGFIALLPILVLFPMELLIPIFISMCLWEFATFIARRHELEADRFAAQRGMGAALVTFLHRAIAVSTPSDFYPSNGERIKALSEWLEEAPCSND